MKNSFKRAWVLLLMGIAFKLSAQKVALHMDGVNDYVSTNYTGISGTNARTVEAWIKTTANCDPNAGGKQKVITDWGAATTGARFTMNVLWGNALRIEVSGSGLSGKKAINDGVWHHVAVVFDNGASNKFRLLVDGVLDTAGNVSTTVNTGNTVNMLIGMRVDNVNSFEGAIDDVKVWDIARTDSAINASYNKELCSGYGSNLKAYFKLDDGNANVTNTGKTNAANKIVASQNGTLNNFALSGSASNWVSGVNTQGGNTFSTIDGFGCYFYTSPSGKKFSSNGVFSDKIANALGCDSILTINVKLGKSVHTIVQPACDSFVSPLGQKTFFSAIVRDTLKNANYVGCDSIVQYAVQMKKSSSSTVNITACDNYMYKSINYTGDTIIIEHLSNAVGCDSVVYTNILIKKTSIGSLDTTACNSYTGPSGKVYTASGAYADTLQNKNHNGCDSIVLINVTINKIKDTSLYTEVCDTFWWNGKFYTTSGLHIQKLQTIHGCDSTVTVNLMVNKSIATSYNEHGCRFINFDNKIYTRDTQFIKYLSTYQGCDSVVTVKFTITTIDTALSLIGNVLTVAQVGATYTWVNCTTNATVASLSNTFTPAQSGSYKAIVNYNMCTDTTACYMVQLAKTQNLKLALAKIVPLPVNEYLSIEGILAPVDILIWDLNGKEIQRISNVNDGERIASPAHGLYIMQLKSGNEIVVLKLLVE